MPDFGHAGTRTVHTSEAAGEIMASAGEFLLCTLDVRGATADFTFACEHNLSIFAPSGPPRAKYQWVAYDDQQSVVAHGDQHTLLLRFSGGAVGYRFRMSVLDATNAVVRTLKDIEYASSDPRDFFPESIGLRTR